MEIKENVYKLLQMVNEDITEDEELDLLAEGLLDSFDIVNLVGSLESTFSVELEATDIVPENFRTISAIAALIEKRRK